MEEFVLQTEKRADNYLRIDCKEGLFRHKDKHPNGEFVTVNSYTKIGGKLENLLIEYVQVGEGALKPYLRIFITSPKESTLMAYSPLNKAISDLINRLAGPVNPMGKTIVLSIWKVNLPNNTSTSNFYLEVDGNRADWKFEPDQMSKIKNAGEKEWVRMFNEFVKPKVDAYAKPTRSQASGHTAPDPVDQHQEDDDLPF
jgi:hypothetical protein